ncbi:MAG: hypothetical protein LM578_02545 [Desulfurococcaceae archaeon]|nr:hypothetical protein [Desulfurococcaceae archaeon]
MEFETQGWFAERRLAPGRAAGLEPAGLGRRRVRFTANEILEALVEHYNPGPLYFFWRALRQLCFILVLHVVFSSI